MKWIKNWNNWLTAYRLKNVLDDIKTKRMNDDLFKTFTDDMANPFTTIRCPKCGYRGQITSDWSPIVGQMMAGSCDWCEHQSKTIDTNRAECDFLVETWIGYKPTEGNK